MDVDNQTPLPSSFLAMYSDGRQRLTLPVAELRARYELCEDLANHLVEQAQQLYHQHLPSEEAVLSGMHAALTGPESELKAAEARWVVLRLAELLGWRSPLL